MDNFPDTILHPETFKNAQWSIECPHCGLTIGFDGVFNWSWTQGCFDDVNKNIAPADFDAVIEREHHFFVIESKGEGVPIPTGQIITLDHLKHPQSFTIMKCWGKNELHKFEIYYPTTKEVIEYSGVESARRILKRWINWANDHRDMRLI